MSKILRCKKCGDIIQSTHRHDMVWCKCGAVAIDGVDDYCKLTGNREDMEFLVAEDNKWFKLKTELEMAIISLMPLKDKVSKATLKAYRNVQLVMKSIEEKENTNG